MIGTKTFNITKQAITIDGTKVYDGSTAVAATDISKFNGLALTETITINGAGSIAAPQVVTNKTLTLGTLSLADGTNGGEASNYSLISGAFDVTNRPITLSGSRVYDATTTVSNSDLTTFNNIVSGESLSITGSGTIADQNVGTNKNVTLGTLALANNTGSASNYSLSSATLNITQRPLNLRQLKLMMEIQHLHLELSLCQIYQEARQLIHTEALLLLQPMLLLMEHQIYLLAHYHSRMEREQLQIIHWLVVLIQQL